MSVIDTTINNSKEDAESWSKYVSVHIDAFPTVWQLWQCHSQEICI